MSHKATNWAVQVRGIKPAAKVVLWHLADRHNKDTGRCDPCQDTLAADCEISRSSLNDQLKTLENGGLIKRIQRVNSATSRKESTAYILNFHIKSPQDVDSHVQNSDTEAMSENDPIPCPKNGQNRVRNSDINPVREPGKNLTRERVFSSLEDFHVDCIRRAIPGTAAHVSPSQAREYLAAKKVTEDQCRKAGVL